jgi:hypothetical protein
MRSQPILSTQSKPLTSNPKELLVYGELYPLFVRRELVAGHKEEKLLSARSTPTIFLPTPKLTVTEDRSAGLSGCRGLLNLPGQVTVNETDAL